MDMTNLFQTLLKQLHNKPTMNWRQHHQTDCVPLQHFLSFFLDSLIYLVIENTNLCSVQKTGKNVNINRKEMKTFIGINMLMGLIKISQYFYFWSSMLWLPAIAQAMPRNRFSQLRQFLHFADSNSEHHSDDKLFNINQSWKLWEMSASRLNQFQILDKQIISSKTKFTKIRQYNTKKSRKWDFKNLARTGSSGFIYDFYL